MKTFQQIREGAKVVFNKKIDKVPVKIVKEPKGFTVYVDGDRLDTFKSEKDGLNSAKTIIKELK